MRYISTRGKAPALNFEEVLLTGLAPDGGLYVPEKLPKYSREEIAGWAGLNYTDLAFKIVQPFVDECIPAADLKKIIDLSSGTIAIRQRRENAANFSAGKLNAMS